MWGNLLKMLAVLFLNRRLMVWKSRWQQLRTHAADYTEDRAQQFKQDFMQETQRLAGSLVALLVAFSMLIFTGLLGLMWLFSLLWQHPHRSLILGLVMLVPAAIGVYAGLQVRALWRQKPLFAESLALISQDWQVFRAEMTPSQAAPEPAPTDGSTTTGSTTAASAPSEPDISPLSTSPTQAPQNP